VIPEEGMFENEDFRHKWTEPLRKDRRYKLAKSVYFFSLEGLFNIAKIRLSEKLSSSSAHDT